LYQKLNFNHIKKSAENLDYEHQYIF